MKKLIIITTFLCILVCGCTRIESILNVVAGEKNSTIDGVDYECTSINLSEVINTLKGIDSIDISIYSNEGKISNGILIRKGEALFHLLHPRSANLSDGKYQIIHRFKENEKRYLFCLSFTIRNGIIVKAENIDPYINNFDKGTGEANDPFQINSVGERKNSLVAVSAAIQCDNEHGLGVYFQLTKDLVFVSDDNVSTTKVVIGCKADTSLQYSEFRGHFDGDGHILMNYYVNYPPYDGAGLFHALGDGAVIKNIQFYNSKVISDNKDVGILAGYVADNANVIIQNIVSNNSLVQGGSNVGGIIGRISGSIAMKDCSVEGKSVVSLESQYGENVGGMVGIARCVYNVSEFSNCSSGTDVQISGNNNIGGLFGAIETSVTTEINNVQNHSSFIEGTGNYVGGITGKATVLGGALKLKKSSNTLSPDASYTHPQLSGISYVGGIIGYCSVYSGASLTLDSLYAGGNHHSSLSFYGGIIGFAEGGGKLILNNVKHIANGEVTFGEGHQGDIGGLIGRLSACSEVSISSSKNEGQLFPSAINYVGGLIGRAISCNKVSFDNTYNCGFISGNIQVGGMIGAVDGSTITISDCNGSGDLLGIVNNTEIQGANGGNDIGGMIGYVANSTITITGGTYPSASGIVGSKETQSDNSGGILGYVINSIVKITDLIVNTSVIGRSGVGGVIGCATADANSYTILDNVSLTTIGINGTNRVGGMAGILEGYNTHIHNCKTISGKINASESQAGGFVGWLDSTNSDEELIVSCNNYASVYSPVDAGGIVGRLQCGNTSAISGISICYNNNYGSVSGTKTVGGIIGFVAGGINPIVDQLINYGTVTNDNDSKYDPRDVKIGGIIGWASESIRIQYCSNRGKVTSQSARYTGGIVGCIGRDGGNYMSTINCCFNSGEVIGEGNSYHQGGIAGAINDVPLDGSGIYNCYNVGYVTGARPAGIISYTGYGGDVHNCFNTGGGGDCGIVKENESSNSFVNNYTNIKNDGSKGNPIYLSDFTNPENFDFDFSSVWIMGSTHPELRYHRE